IHPICICCPAYAGKRTLDVVPDEEVATSRPHDKPRLGRIDGFQVEFGANETAELRIAPVGDSLTWFGRATSAARRTSFGIEKIVGISQPKQVIIQSQQKRFERLERGAEARIINVAPAHKIHVTVEPVIGGKKIVERLTLAVLGVAVAGSKIIFQSQ